MQLNRAVCIDFPEAGVPWFQQNYIEAQMTKCKICYICVVYRWLGLYALISSMKLYIEVVYQIV